MVWWIILAIDDEITKIIKEELSECDSRLNEDLVEDTQKKTIQAVKG